MASMEAAFTYAETPSAATNECSSAQLMRHRWFSTIAWSLWHFMRFFAGAIRRVAFPVAMSAH
jgi:hypothetical protein